MKKVFVMMLTLVLLACVGCNAPEAPVATEPAAISAAPDRDVTADAMTDLLELDPMSQMTVEKTPVGDCVVHFQAYRHGYVMDLDELSFAARLPIGLRKVMVPPAIKGYRPDQEEYVIDITEEGYGNIISYYPDPAQTEGMELNVEVGSLEWRKVVTVEIRRIDVSNEEILTRDTIELPEGGAYWCPLEYPGYALLGDWQGTTALEGTVPRGADDVIVEEIFYTPVEA